jgi:predicted nucleotidyltransferase
MFGPVREPLSYALGTHGRVRTLRVLTLIREPITQREVARRARLQHRTVQLALDDLVHLGIVSRIQGGRDFLVSLDRGHRLAPPLAQLFRVEAEHFLELRSALSRLVADEQRQNGVLSLVLYGSAARAEDSTESDLDLLVVAENAVAVESALTRLEVGKEEVQQRFGVSLHSIGYTLAQARRIWRQKRPPLHDAQRDGIPLVGPPLRQLLSGEDC